MKRGRKKRSWRGRIVRWVVGLVLVLAGVTALPVLLLRWCDPPISAFMLQAKWAADEKAALLAAVLPSPRRLRVERPSPYVRARQEWIMAQMRGLGGRAYLRRQQ